MNEITSKNIRELDSVFRFYTVLALISAVVFISSVAVENWIASCVSIGFTLLTCFVAYRAEVKIAAQKTRAQALSDARDVKVAALYGKETSDEEKHSNV